MESMTDFWKEVEGLLEPMQPPNIFYRLYYDDNGHVLFYSMEDLPGNYIEIDRDTFVLGPLNVRVRAGKIVEVTRISNKLTPGTSGTMCHKTDISVITTTGQYWTMKNYESED
jgi:hypothetical protein